MRPEQLTAAIEGEDERAVLAAVTACAKALRGGDVTIERIDLAEVMCSLLDHASPEVRQEIAHVCDTFPDPFFTQALEQLTRDTDRFVQNAARRAGERRARARKERRKDETREQVLAELLAAIEKDHGPNGRRLAERAVRRGIEHFVVRLDHEVSKSDRATERALVELDAEIGKRDPNPAALRRQTAVLREHFGLVRSMIERGCAYAAQAKPVFAEEGLAAIVDQARGQLLDRLGERAARVDFVNDVSPRLRLHADRGALLQALQNVLQNAVEAYEAGRARLAVQVTARLLLAGAQVELTVTDRGQGITEEGMRTLFLPFGSSKPGGTGVGMLIARKMIEEVHAGELVVDSKVGSGTTVTIRLPAKQPGVRR